MAWGLGRAKAMTWCMDASKFAGQPCQQCYQHWSRCTQHARPSITHIIVMLARMLATVWRTGVSAQGGRRVSKVSSAMCPLPPSLPLPAKMSSPAVSISPECLLSSRQVPGGDKADAARVTVCSLPLTGTQAQLPIGCRATMVEQVNACKSGEQGGGVGLASAIGKLLR